MAIVATRWKPRFISTERLRLVPAVQIQKQQVASGFGFRLPVQLFSFIHDSFGDREGQSGRQAEGEREARTYKSTSVGHSTPRIPSSADLRGPLQVAHPVVAPSQWT